MSVRPLHDDQVGPMWAAYAEAVGLSKLQATFGEHWPPKGPRVGERVFLWYDGEMFVGWLSLSPDQFDPTTVHMSRGVWPDRHGAGVGREMRAFAEGWCEANGADALQIHVFVANWQHLAKVMDDEYWDIEGATFAPAGFSFQHQIKPLAAASS